MALQLAWDIALQKIPTLFLSLEMYEEDIIERLFCLDQKVDNFDLLTGKFNINWSKWEVFKERMSSIPFVITDMIGKEWKQIDEYLQKLTMKPKVIIIDHLQEARNALLRNQKEVIEEYLKRLRLMAIRDDIAMVVCSQINRASQEDKKNEPQLHHLKNSGYIEESADMIFLLHYPFHHGETQDKTKFSLNVAKNRNGRTGWIDISYRPECYFFYEEVKEEEQNKPVHDTRWDE